MNDWNVYDNRMLTAGRDHLGQTVTYTPVSTGVAQTLRAVYTRESVLIDAVGDVGVREQLCTLEYVVADFVPAPIVRDVIVVGGQTFVVASPPQAEGQGGAIIDLTTQSQ